MQQTHFALETVQWVSARVKCCAPVVCVVRQAALLHDVPQAECLILFESRSHLQQQRPFFIQQQQPAAACNILGVVVVWSYLFSGSRWLTTRW